MGWLIRFAALRRRAIRQPTVFPQTIRRQASRPRGGLARITGGWTVLLPALLAVASCGDDDADAGRFGDPQVLRAYRDALNPIIDRVSGIEAEVQERAVGSSNVATAANLSAVYTEVRPDLLESLVDLDRLTPPPALAALHADIRRLIILRLDAYRLVIDGFAAADSSLYPEAEARLREANALIVEVNLGLCEIDIALGDLEDCRLLAGARPSGEEGRNLSWPERQAGTGIAGRRADAGRGPAVSVDVEGVAHLLQGLFIGV